MGKKRRIVESGRFTSSVLEGYVERQMKVIDGRVEDRYENGYVPSSTKEERCKYFAERTLRRVRTKWCNEVRSKPLQAMTGGSGLMSRLNDPDLPAGEPSVVAPKGCIR